MYETYFVELRMGGGCGQKAGQVQAVTWEWITLFAYEKRARALQMYEETHSVTETIRVLGYPGRQTLYKWISKQNQPKKVKSPYRGENTETHPRHPPVKLKLEVLNRCFELGEDVKSVSDEIGYSQASIYTWRRKYLRKGMTALMNPEDDSRGKLVPGTASSSEEINELKSEVEDMRMQIDILICLLPCIVRAAATITNKRP